MPKTTNHDQMVSSLLASQLQEQLDALDEGDSAGTWFAAASRALSPKDYDRYVAACRKRLTAMLREADGCPAKIFEWHEHFAAKEL